MKNNKGVTIMTLIITIIVMLIIVSITVYYGLTQNLEKATETQTVYQVHEIIDAVTNRNMMHKINSSYYKYIGKTGFEPIEITENGLTKLYTSSDGWYLVEDKAEFDALGLDNITGEYLINYSNGMVVSVEGVLYKDKLYHLLNDLKKEMGGGTSVLSHVEYDSSKKVNRPVLSNGMVPVKLVGTEWVVTSTDDIGWYDYSKEQMAWANVMLMDELSVEGYDNATLKNTPISELVGKKVITEGSAYVWIPRYTTTSIGGTGSKIIFSNLISDTTNVNGEIYTCPDSFRFGEGSETLELTGIWVSKYEASFNN